MEAKSCLTDAKVREIFEECLFNDGSDKGTSIKVESITEAEFHTDRLANHRQKIEDMLAELPDVFKESGGGGGSFLAACNDRHGRQWTGSQATMAQLFLLGIAIDMVSCPLPRNLWSILPGGVPYYIVDVK